MRYGPLYPVDDALRPLSVFGCKYATDAACRAVAHDVAFDGPAPPRCPACGSPVEASKGRVVGASVIDHTRVELDPLGRAATGQLFTRRALAPGTRLTGLVSGELDNGLAWLAAPDLPIRLGGRRSTSGLATLTARAEPAPAEFSGYLPKQRQLVVRLVSPGIFVDGLGRPSWLPDLDELTGALGVPVALDAAFARPTVVAGWHAASNLPKPRDFAVAAGSVYVVRFDAGLPDRDGLHRLWTAGLGLRRVEGNGWVSLQRWRAPASAPAAVPAPPDALRTLLVEIMAYGIGPTVVDDLRVWSQENRGARADAERLREALLAKRRYDRLGDEARAVVARCFALTADDAGRLSAQVADVLRARTSTRGRT